MGLGFLSAIIDNIPFVATMIPLIKSMAPAFGGADKILPLWWCLSLGACLGGNGTLIGACANLTVAGIAERNGIRFGFVRYLAYGAPMTLVLIASANLRLGPILLIDLPFCLRFMGVKRPFAFCLPYPPIPIDYAGGTVGPREPTSAASGAARAGTVPACGALRAPTGLG